MGVRVKARTRGRVGAQARWRETVSVYEGKGKRSSGCAGEMARDGKCMQGQVGMWVKVRV